MAEKEKIYKCLSPVGNQVPVDVHPLTPRLDKLDGKEIYFSISGEPDITIALEKELKTRYPDVDWKVKKTYSTNPIPLSEEEKKTCDGLIQGVSW
ncbi:MAG: hypothetical protein HYX80_08305 [Chloroflexi bacterium]|nr:hypothetical protein [Chloroflexota bacterium]